MNCHLSAAGAVQATPGVVTPLNVSYRKSVLCGALVWARSALTSQTGGFRARAVGRQEWGRAPRLAVQEADDAAGEPPGRLCLGPPQARRRGPHPRSAMCSFRTNLCRAGRGPDACHSGPHCTGAATRCQCCAGLTRGRRSAVNLQSGLGPPNFDGVVRRRPWHSVAVRPRRPRTFHASCIAPTTNSRTRRPATHILVASPAGLDGRHELPAGRGGARGGDPGWCSSAQCRAVQHSAGAVRHSVNRFSAAWALC